MLKHILPLIPAHKIYTEAFCGGAAVLFAKEPVASEVINDINGELTNFYWIAQCYYPELKIEIDKTLHSREIHDHAVHIYKHPQFFRPAECAWAIWYLSKSAFASKLNGSFGYDFSGGMSKKIRNAKDAVTQDLCNRLSHVTIENRNASKVIECYDRIDAFHFVDPPYIETCCAHYDNTFNEQALTELLSQLSNIKGKFMLTMFPNDHITQYVTKFRWTIHSIERTISASKTTRRKQEEWIICNY